MPPNSNTQIHPVRTLFVSLVSTRTSKFRKWSVAFLLNQCLELHLMSRKKNLLNSSKKYFFQGTFYNSQQKSYIVGSPRAGGKRAGEVHLIKPFPLNSNKSQNIEIIQTLSGLQLGEYFGSSFAAVDLNGDGLDELVVGSPLATHEQVI